jgi:LmbE family N-acetylglucosaminyl deacetylase
MTTPEQRASILVIGAHPDDDIIGCGGSIEQHTKRNDNVHVAYLTSGESGNREYPPEILGPMREQEARKSGALLGVQATAFSFLHYPDRMLSEAKDAASQNIVDIIRDTQPNRIYLPHASDGHPDHEAVFAATQQAFHEIDDTDFDADTCEVLGYEIWEPIKAPNHFIALSARGLAKKIQAMRVHKTQMLKMAYDDKIVQTATKRGQDSAISQYAEAFHLYRDFPSHTI